MIIVFSLLSDSRSHNHVLILGKNIKSAIIISLNYKSLNAV
jgi:hypothetical protein